MFPEHCIGQGTCSLLWCHYILSILLQTGSCTAGSAGPRVAATGQRSRRGSDGNHSGSGGQAGCGEAVHFAYLIVLERMRQGWS